MGDVAVGDGRAVEIDVAHMVAVAASYRSTHVPTVEGVQGKVEGGSGIGVPVAVDVFRAVQTMRIFLTVIRC